MTIIPWQLHTPVDAIMFDCDGTLSTIEGIDQLAMHNGTSEKVVALTAKAMGQTGINPDIYQERLRIVQPTHAQIQALGQEYFSHQVVDAKAVITTFKQLKKSIYLISAGLYPALCIFGELLGIPKENIFGVGIQFDSQGNYVDFDHQSALIYSDGKRKIIHELKKHHPKIAYVGDGLNDYAVYDLVERFIGYGGAFYRQNIADLCQFYIRTPSLAPLLPLSLTQEEYEKLATAEKSLYQQGLEAIKQGDVITLLTMH